MKVEFFLSKNSGDLQKLQNLVGMFGTVVITSETTSYYEVTATTEDKAVYQIIINFRNLKYKDNAKPTL